MKEENEDSTKMCVLHCSEHTMNDYCNPAHFSLTDAWKSVISQHNILQSVDQ